MQDSHSCDPGSIPGRCSAFFMDTGKIPTYWHPQMEKLSIRLNNTGEKKHNFSEDRQKLTKVNDFPVSRTFGCWLAWRVDQDMTISNIYNRHRPAEIVSCLSHVNTQHNIMPWYLGVKKIDNSTQAVSANTVLKSGRQF